MADENTKVQMTEKQKVKEITDRLEAGLRNFSRVKSTKAISAPCRNFTITVLITLC